MDKLQSTSYYNKENIIFYIISIPFLCFSFVIYYFGVIESSSDLRIYIALVSGIVGLFFLFPHNSLVTSKIILLLSVFSSVIALYAYEGFLIY